jgi:hypothetical protein
MKLKEYSLQECSPCFVLDVGRISSNQEIGRTIATTKAIAVAQLQAQRPDLGLNADGYAKHGNITYCVAECYCPIN